MSDIIIDNDSGKFKAGDGQDLNLYHNGTNSFVENETGILYVTNKANTSLILGTNNTTALTIDNSQDATFAGAVTLQDQLTVKAEGSSNDIVAQWQATNGNNCATFRTTDSGHVFKIMSQNSGTLEFETSSATFTTGAASTTLQIHSGTGSSTTGISQIYFTSKDEHGGNTHQSYIKSTIDGSSSTSATKMSFHNRDSGGTVQEYLTIKADGSVTFAGHVVGKTAASHSSTTVDGDFSGASFYADGGDMVMGRAFFVGQNGGGTKLLGFNNEGTGGSSCLVLHNYTDSASHTRFYHGGDVEILDGNLKFADGHGIDFSAHGQDGGMTSELLDDYEEGTWSPQVWNNYSGGTQLGAGTAVGRYVKIGQLVHIQGYWVCDGLNAASGDTYLRNLPYVSHSTANLYGAISIGYCANFSITAGTSVSSYVNHNGSAAIGLLQYDASTGISSLQASEISADGAIIFGGTYITN